MKKITTAVFTLFAATLILGGCSKSAAKKDYILATVELVVLITHLVVQLLTFGIQKLKE